LKKRKEHFRWFSFAVFGRLNYGECIHKIFCRLLEYCTTAETQRQASPRSAPQYFSSAAAATAPSDAAVMTCRKGLTQMSPAA